MGTEHQFVRQETPHALEDRAVCRASGNYGRRPIRLARIDRLALLGAADGYPRRRTSTPLPPCVLEALLSVATPSPVKRRPAPALGGCRRYAAADEDRSIGVADHITRDALAEPSAP
jgi:hypothetical protein